jgi:hypothetical protein
MSKMIGVSAAYTLNLNHKMTPWPSIITHYQAKYSLAETHSPNKLPEALPATLPLIPEGKIQFGFIFTWLYEQAGNHKGHRKNFTDLHFHRIKSDAQCA